MTDGILRLIPGLRVARAYERSWLPADIVAGLVLTAILIPVGMGYAQAAGLPAIAGLYATIVPLLLYAVFGPSRILVLGPDSSLAAIIAATVAPLALGDAARVPGSRRRARPHLRRVLHRVRRPAPRPAHRAAVEADPDRVPERDRADRVHQPAPEAVRVLGRRGRRAHDRVRASWRASPTARPSRRPWRSASRRSPSSSAAVAGCRPIPGVLIAAVGGTAIVGFLGLAASAGVPVVGPLPQGLPTFGDPGGVARGRHGDGGGRARHRGGLDGGHERAVAVPRGQGRRARRPEPGDAGAGGRQRRHGPVPRLLRSAPARRGRPSRPRRARRPSWPGSSGP